MFAINIIFDIKNFKRSILFRSTPLLIMCDEILQLISINNWNEINFKAIEHIKCLVFILSHIFINFFSIIWDYGLSKYFSDRCRRSYIRVNTLRTTHPLTVLIVFWTQQRCVAFIKCTQRIITLSHFRRCMPCWEQTW